MDARTSRRRLLHGGAGLSLLALAGCASDDGATPAPSSSSSPAGTPNPSSTPTPTPSTVATPTPSQTAAPDPQVAGEVVTGLAVPWGMVFLPDGSALVGARDTGELMRVSDGSASRVGTFDVRSRVDEAGESGLLGLALHPDFATNRSLYAYLSSADDNRVVVATFAGSLGTPRPILTGIGASVHHNGGGLAFGPDGMLYASTGDAEDSSSAPDTTSLDGKVLRMTDAGEVPADNPFDNHVWSYGHRNVEGLAFDDQGRLWASEFGDKGADELNLIKAGQDHGWPAVEGDSGGEYADPLAQWPVDQCSPAGIAVTRGRAWLGALRGECVWSVVLDGPDAGRTERHLGDGGYGRIRSVALAPDGSLWVGTSNRDGRADPGPGDDRILRVTL